MILHSLRLKIRGNVVESFGDDARELDIADEFARLSRSLGLEGIPDTYAGLWATQPIYDEHSLLRGDFLAKELHLDLLCDASFSIPFSAILLCLGESLRRVAVCKIVEMTVLCEPYSVSIALKRERFKGNLQCFFGVNAKRNPLPVAHCSTMHCTVIDKHNSVVSAEEVPLMISQCYLPELALPFSGFWSQWEESLHYVGMVQITAN